MFHHQPFRERFDIMGLLNKKMLLAPVLAITLALLLAGAVSFLPQAILQGQPTPQPTSGSLQTPLPTTAVALATSTSYGGLLTIVFAVAAIIVGIVAAFLFLSEKKIKKEISG